MNTHKDKGEKKKLLKNYAYNISVFSGVDTLSGKMEVFSIIANKKLRKPKGWKVAVIQQIGKQWRHIYYKDPVYPTFWDRVKYIFTGKPFGLYRNSPITFEGQKFIK